MSLLSIPRPLRALVLLVALSALVLAVASVEPAAAQSEEAGVPDESFEGRRIASIEVLGDQRYSEGRLLDGFGARVGQPYSAAQVEDGLERLWEVFQVRAEVKGKHVEGGVALRLIVTELPVDLEPRFIGNAEIELDELLEWAQLEDRRELHLHEVNRIAARLIEAYKREGFYFVEVNPVVREIGKGDEPSTMGDVIFEIVEGPHVNVDEIVIHGNDSLPDRGSWFWKDGLSMLAQLQLEGPHLFDWNGADFDEETLRADIVAMRNVYRDAGFLNAVVDLDRLEFSEDHSWVTVHIVVDEGLPFTVTKVSIQAFEVVPDPRRETALPREEPAELLYPESELLSELTLKPGKRYKRTLVDADHFVLRDFYGERGHIEHISLGDRYSWQWLEPDLVYDLEQAEVEVIYRVSQGRPVTIGEVRFAGATHTRDSVLRREVSVKPGQLADMSEIIGSLRRLTSTGYFSEDNDPEHRDPTFRFVQTEKEGVVDIEFVVEEGQVVQFWLGGGLDSNSGLFGTLSLSMNNFDLFDIPDSFFGAFGEIYRKEAFHGAGQRLELVLSPGVERDFTKIRFLEPDIFGLHEDRIMFDGELSRWNQRYEDYDERRVTREAKLGRQLGFNSSLWLGFSNVDLALTDVDSQIDLEDPALASLAQEVGSNSLIGLSLSLRHRDTDTAYNPHDGRVMWVGSEWKTHHLGSDWEYLRGEFSWDEYLPIGVDTEEVRPGFRIAAGGGVEVPYGRSSLIPYSERFHLGGFSTVRGFRYRGVGPAAESGVPIGGESMLRGSLEFRLPILTITQPGTYRQIEMLRLHWFVDSGVLGPDYSRLDFDETRASWGFGFGLIHPMPLVFDFAWPLREGPLDRTRVFSFNLAVR